MKSLLATKRLFLSEFDINDAPFLFQLMNDPDWILNIGDREINSIEDAEKFISNKFFKSYKENGFGFYMIRLLENNSPIGICGLINRQGLKHVDIGYALLPRFRGKGYAFEATESLYEYGHNKLKIDVIVAIVNSDNNKSIALLEKLGLHFEKMITLPNDTKEIKLFSPD
jgi:RimJ/RimL family protein N-acetyltransferase